jgi:hypothetical protein
MRQIGQQKDCIAARQPDALRGMVRACGQVKPAMAMQQDVEARAPVSGGRGLPGAAILADVEQRALQFETVEQSVGEGIDVGLHGGSGIEGAARAVRDPQP